MMLRTFIQDVNSYLENPIRVCDHEIQKYAATEPVQREAINCCVRAMAKAIQTNDMLHFSKV